MERYQITLHSPMGPRRGTLELLGDGRAIVELLGFSSLFKAERPDAEHLRLTGQLDSVMGKIELRAEMVILNGSFDSMAHTGKGDMRLTGSRADGTE